MRDPISILNNHSDSVEVNAQILQYFAHPTQISNRFCRKNESSPEFIKRRSLWHQINSSAKLPYSGTSQSKNHALKSRDQLNYEQISQGFVSVVKYLIYAPAVNFFVAEQTAGIFARRLSKHSRPALRTDLLQQVIPAKTVGKFIAHCIAALGGKCDAASSLDCIFNKALEAVLIEHHR